MLNIKLEFYTKLSRPSIIIVLLYLLPVTIFSQSPEHNWVQPFINNSQAIHAPKVLIDQDKNLIIGGLFQGEIDFDFLDGIELRSGKMFVLKMTPDKELLWVKTFFADNSGPSHFDIDIDPEGYVYYTSSYFRKVEETYADKEATTLIEHPERNEVDTYVLKLNGIDGNIIYQKSLSQGSNDGLIKPLSISADKDGNVALLGYFHDKVQFDPAGNEPISESNGNSDIYLIRFDRDGNYVWHRAIGDEAYEYGNRCDHDNDGNIILGGVFRYTMDFDEGPEEFILKNNGGYDIFIFKLSPQNEILWGESFGSARYDNIRNLSIGPDNEIWVCGSFRGRMDIDPSPDTQELIYNIGDSDGLVFGLTSDGALLWHNEYGGPEYDTCEGIFVDVSGNVFANCQSTGSLVFQEDNIKLDLNGNYNSLVRKWTKDGKIDWAYKLSSYNGITGAGHYPFNVGGITASSDGNLITSGVFAYGLDFDPSNDVDSIEVPTTLKMFLHKLRHCTPQLYKQDIDFVGSHTLSNGIIITEAGIYYDTLYNSSGCDSILMLNLSNIKPKEALQQIKIGPVPTVNQLNIFSNLSIENCKITLFNDLSQIVWSNDGIDIFPPRFTIEMNQNEIIIPSGLYILKLEVGDFYRNFKILVTR